MNPATLLWVYDAAIFLFKLRESGDVGELRAKIDVLLETLQAKLPAKPADVSWEEHITNQRAHLLSVLSEIEARHGGV